MNHVSGFLSRALASKAEMYGFPLVVWSSGALQVNRFGAPALAGVLCFLGGALAAMMIMVLVSCRRLSALLPVRDSRIRASGGIHVVSVVGGVLAGWAAAGETHGGLAFFLASFVTVLIFEILLSLELYVAARDCRTRTTDQMSALPLEPSLVPPRDRKVP